MPEIQPFRAWRYDLGHVGTLSEVTAPPYDVIDEALQQRLYERHSYNVVRLILNRIEPTDDDQNNRYTRAAACWRDWQREGILRQDSEPALYVYHQEFSWKGQTYVRRAILAVVRLEPFGQGKVYPHEETLPGPKEDRLRLLRATAANFCPLFGLYPDEDGTAQRLLDESVERWPPLQAQDDQGVVHRLWRVIEPHLINELQRWLYPRPLYIADGHHRYETALRYREELRQAGLVNSDSAPANYVLMGLVGMSDPGLLILPTHRLFRGAQSLSADMLTAALCEHFEVELYGQGESAGLELGELIEADTDQSVLGFGLADGSWILARLRRTQRLAELLPQRSEAWRSLAVSVLHELVLRDCLRNYQPDTWQVTYVHQAAQAVQALARHMSDFVALVPPVSMAHLVAITQHHERMPPKSTYFYPKLLSGLVFYSLRGGG
ncbi:MAG: DUF1015 domain-containing protein [Gemmatales bacterium]|nr:DUF1015 domain-containing protein [Gemmatales bacterium]